MSADGQLDDDDTQWRPRPDRDDGEGSGPAERSGEPDPREHPPLARIVLSDGGSASEWARRADGDDANAVDGHDREDEPLRDASTWDADMLASVGVVATAPGLDPTGGVRLSASPVSVSEASGDDHADESGSTSVRRRSIVAVAAGVLAVSVVIAVALVALLRGGESARSTSSAPELPSGAEIAWTNRVDGAVEATTVGEGLVVVASADGVTALSEGDGEVMWRRMHAAGAGDIRRVAVMGDRVVVTQQRPTGTTEVRAFDSGTGTEIWRTGGDDGTYSISGPVDGPAIVGRLRVDGGTVLTLLDPVDGSALGDPVRLSSVEATGDDLGVVPSDERVAVWSVRDGEIVAGPVDAFNLRTVAELDGSVVALDLEGRIVAFDEGGRRTDELLVVGNDSAPDGSAAIAQVDFVGVAPSEQVGIVSGESSFGFTVVDGRIEIVWRRDGSVATPASTSIGDLSVLVGRDDGGDGAVGEVIIDPVSGRTVTAVEVPGPWERISTLGSNGFLVAPTVGATERIVSAVGYDGEPLWWLTLAPEADYDLVGGVVLIVEPTPDGDSLSVAR